MITPDQIQKILDFVDDPIDLDGEHELLSDGEVLDLVHDLLEELLTQNQ